MAAKKKSFAWGKLILVLIGLLVVAQLFIDRCTVHTKTVTVVKKYQEKDSKDFVIVTDKGKFVDETSLWHFKIGSGHIYSEMQVGKTYTIKYYGWRWKWMGWPPNIIKITSAESSDPKYSNYEP